MRSTFIDRIVISKIEIIDTSSINYRVEIVISKVITNTIITLLKTRLI